MRGQADEFPAVQQEHYPLPPQPQRGDHPLRAHWRLCLSQTSPDRFYALARIAAGRCRKNRMPALPGERRPPAYGPHRLHRCFHRYTARPAKGERNDRCGTGSIFPRQPDYLYLKDAYENLFYTFLLRACPVCPVAKDRRCVKERCDRWAEYVFFGGRRA